MKRRLIETVGGGLIAITDIGLEDGKFLITEASVIPFTPNFQLNERFALNEGNFKSGELVISGKLQNAGDLNQNGRIYPRHVLEREIQRYQKLMEKNLAIGEMEHPDRTIIERDRVSHRILKLWWEGNDLMGHIKILSDFPMGAILKASWEDGQPIGFSTRGVGSVTEKGGKAIVNEDYQLICWDAVVDPSTINAFATKTINESIESRTSDLDSLLERILK